MGGACGNGPPEKGKLRMKKNTWIIAVAMVAAGLAAACRGGDKGEAAAPAVEPAAVEAAAEEVGAAAVEAAPAAVGAEKVVAKVNGTEITEADVESVLDTIRKQMEGRLPADQAAAMLPRIRSRIVDELIMRQIMRDALKAEGVTMSDEELDAVKAELSAELPPGMTLEAYMEQTGTSEDDFREQMTIRKMVMAKIEAAPAPTEEEVRAFYDENRQGFEQPESVKASHILVKFEDGDDADAKAAKLAKINGLKAELEGGADFAELAKANSDCPSSANGGDLGAFRRGSMVPPFEDAAFKQEVGKVGDVVETQFGYHLILVTERNEAKTMEFDEVKEEIGEMLLSQKQQTVAMEYLHSLEDAATVERFDESAADEPEAGGLLLEVEEEEVDLDAGSAAEADAAMDAVVDETAASLDAAATEAADAAESVADEAADAVEGAADGAAEAADGALENAKAALSDFADAAGEKVAEAKEAAGEALEAAGDKAAEVAAAAKEKAVEAKAAAADALEAAGDKAAELKAAAGEALEAAGENVKAAGKAVGETVKEAADAMSDAATEALDAVRGADAAETPAE